MHYTFTLTQKHTTNTDLVGPDGRTVYRVETPWKLGAKNTRVLATSRGGSRVVGAMNWRVLGNTELSINGKKVVPQSSGMFNQ